MTRSATKRAREDELNLALIVNSIPVPEPAEDYGRRVWQQISPRLPQPGAHWWDFLFSESKPGSWLAPRRWVAAGALAGLVLAAFIAGRATNFAADSQRRVSLSLRFIRTRSTRIPCTPAKTAV